jgi:PAS domain S-box-containing protein
MDLAGCGALSSALIASALDSAGVAVVVTDLDLEPPGPLIRYVNVTFEEMTGYAASEVLGRSPRILQGPLTDRAVLHRLKRCLLEEGRFRGEAINYRKDGTAFWLEWIITPVRDPQGTPTHWIAFQRDVSRHRSRHRTFDAELQHRTGNLLGMVRSLAARTLADKAGAAAFGARLAALSRSQRLFASSFPHGPELATLLRGELAAHGIRDGRVSLHGPKLAVPMPMIEMLVLAMHELIDNAQTHGTFRFEDGALAIEWRIIKEAEGRILVLDWVETGTAPLPAEQRQRGYGQEMLEAALPFSLDARTSLTFREDGMSCRIELPLAGASAGAQRMAG